MIWNKEVALTDVPNDIRAILTERAGPGILGLITSIRTSYIGQTFEDHSGTGLLLTNEQGQTFCLTANHVVTPSSRVPPDSREVVQHLYVENLGRVDSIGRIFLDDDSAIPPPIRLRRKYFKSEDCDLAMLGSCFNGHDVPPGIRRTNYYPYNFLAGANLNQVLNEDIFAVCGFPGALMTSFPESRLINYSPLMHLFTGLQGASHSSDSKRYTIEYADANPSPHGLSGAPVWLLRETISPTTPLDTNRIRDCCKRGDPVNITSWFAGIVASYDQSAGRIQVIRPEVCAEFATKAERSQLDLTDEDEDKMIKEQFDYFIERYGDKWRQ